MIRMSVVFLLSASVASGSFPAGERYSIDVMVTGAEPSEGQVLASLFDSPGSYMKEPLAEVEITIDAEGVALVDFGKHQPAEYAVVVIYDRNANGELDTGLFGIPKEKVGFSNNAKGRFGPAKWGDARFLLSDANIRIDIQLVRAKEK